MLARLLARLEIGDLAGRLAQVVLALVRIALFAVNPPRGGGSCKIFQSLRMCIVGRLRFLTPCAEVAAPPVGVERDAPAR